MCHVVTKWGLGIQNTRKKIIAWGKIDSFTIFRHVMVTNPSPCDLLLGMERWYESQNIQEEICWILMYLGNIVLKHNFFYLLFFTPFAQYLRLALHPSQFRHLFSSQPHICFVTIVCTAVVLANSFKRQRSKQAAKVLKTAAGVVLLTAPICRTRGQHIQSAGLRLTKESEKT